MRIGLKSWLCKKSPIHIFMSFSDVIRRIDSIQFIFWNFSKLRCIELMMTSSVAGFASYLHQLKRMTEIKDDIITLRIKSNAESCVTSYLASISWWRNWLWSKSCAKSLIADWSSCQLRPPLVSTTIAPTSLKVTIWRSKWRHSPTSSWRKSLGSWLVSKWWRNWRHTNVQQDPIVSLQIEIPAGSCVTSVGGWWSMTSVTRVLSAFNWLWRVTTNYDSVRGIT